MVNIVVESNERQDLKAVVGSTKTGIYVSDPDNPNRSLYINFNTFTVTSDQNSLSDLLTNHTRREPVYTGDTIKLTF